MAKNTFHGVSVQGERIMHTPSTFAKSNLIYLQEIGTSKYIAPHTSIRGSQNSFLFCFVGEGAGSLTYLNQQYSLIAGDCFFIDCRNPYTIASLEQLWTIHWIHVNGGNLSAIYDKFIERCGAPYFHCIQIESMQKRMDDLFAVASSEEYVKDMLLAEGIMGLIAESMKQSWHQGASLSQSSYRRSILPIQEYIDEHFAEEILSLEILAEQFGYNKFYLSRRFKEEYGVTVNQYIVQKKVTAAKHLLRFSDLTISEIAKETGVDDPNYFSRMFRAVEGLSPSQFRKSWKPKNV